MTIPQTSNSESTALSPRAEKQLVTKGLGVSARLKAALTILGVLEPFSDEDRITVLNYVSAETDGEMVGR